LDQAPNEAGRGRKIGHYTVVEQIGHGGMGEVFSAFRSDGQFEQKVAIKLVRTGADSAAVLERFRNERQILAGLDHPNIARLLDGGTTGDGVPFLVMELVSGTPIDTFCDARKLSIPRRLELFRQVCSAVQYAHQHLVIHRDIKPANILVTEDGTPKLLDFGIAKLVDDSGQVAATQIRSFTTDYASPEQLRGDSISTASDLYSLGVVLYRLLTGRSPYRVEPRTPAKLANAITNTDPDRPSTSVTRTETATSTDSSRELTPEFFSDARDTTPALLQKKLRGELDDILLKALRKEPERRYASVEQFSEDIRLYLAGHPVLARKGTWNYRAGKFLRRHRAGVAAASLVAATLIAGVLVTWREARIAEANRRKADARFNDVRKLANSLVFDVHDKIQNLPGAADSRKLILQKAVGYLDTLAADTQNDPALMRDLVVGYSRIAELEGNPYHPNLGDTKAALADYQKSLTLEEALVRMYPDSEKDQFNLAQLYADLSEVHMAGTGNVPEAIRYCDQSIMLFDKLLSSKPNDVAILKQAMSAYVTFGLLRIGNGVSGTSGTVESGVAVLEKALAYDRRAIKLEPSDVSLAAEEASIDIALGDAYLKLGNRSLAEESFRSGLKIFEALDPKGENVRVFLNKAVTITKVGDALMIEGKYADALGYYKEGLTLGERLLALDKKSESAQSLAVIARGQVALALTHLGHYAEANQMFRAAQAYSAAVAGQTAIVHVIKSIIGVWFAQSLQRQGKLADAAREFGKSKAILTALGGGGQLDVRTQTYLCAAETGLGSALTAQGKFADAQKEMESAIASLEKLANAAPPQQELLYTLAESYNEAGVLYSTRAKQSSSQVAQLADLKIAQSWFQKSVEIWRKVKNPARFNTIGFEVSLPAEVSQRLAECDWRIRSLENPPN